MKDPILSEAKSLYGLGIAVHWLRPNSKAPIKGGWSGPERDDWELLTREYQPGYGLGIRLGQPSCIMGKFLAVIDLDVRSNNSQHLREAIAIIDSEFPGVRSRAPKVITGRGFKSAHYYVLTELPLQSRKLGVSEERVPVFSRSSKISSFQLGCLEGGEITKQQLKDGYRLKAAWEVEFMSIGKQVVAPPTLHVDTKKPYRWARPLK